MNIGKRFNRSLVCVPGFGAGFEIALEPSELQEEGENSGKGHFYFLRQTLVCTKPWFKRDLRIGKNEPSAKAKNLARSVNHECFFRGLLR